MPKTLAEIAIEAGLVTKAGAAKAGRMAEERKEPLVVMLIRELGVDEVALVGALRKQTRVPLLDPATIQIDPEALRHGAARRRAPGCACCRSALTTDGKTAVLRARDGRSDRHRRRSLEIEQLTPAARSRSSALPLSAIEELVDKGYRQFIDRGRAAGPAGRTMFVTSKRQDRARSRRRVARSSVTAQIPMSALQPPAPTTSRRGSTP